MQAREFKRVIEIVLDQLGYLQNMLLKIGGGVEGAIPLGSVALKLLLGTWSSLWPFWTAGYTETDITNLQFLNLSSVITSHNKRQIHHRKTLENVLLTLFLQVFGLVGWANYWLYLILSIMREKQSLVLYHFIYRGLSYKTIDVWFIVITTCGREKPP